MLCVLFVLDLVVVLPELNQSRGLRQHRADPRPVSLLACAVALVQGQGLREGKGNQAVTMLGYQISSRGRRKRRNEKNGVRQPAGVLFSEELLTVEGQLDPSEVDVSFDIPNRDWSKGISKPTINCYLFDIREHRDLRHGGTTMDVTPSKGVARRRLPMFVGLTYLITAWTRAVEDEHRLLFHALKTLMRFGVIPSQHVQGSLKQHELPIHTQIAQPDGVLKSPGEFWTAL